MHLCYRKKAEFSRAFTERMLIKFKIKLFNQFVYLVTKKCKHEFIAAKRKSTMCRNGDPILPRKKTLLAKLKVAGHVSSLAT